MSSKRKIWMTPIFDQDDESHLCKKEKESSNLVQQEAKVVTVELPQVSSKIVPNISIKTLIKNFEPTSPDDLAVNKKKMQEVEEWLNNSCSNNASSMLLMTGPVGCAKTATLKVLTKKLNVKVMEWVTPIDIEIIAENGNYEFKEKQSLRFLNFILNAANFTSLLDNNSKKLILVEDFPNTFLRTPAEFTDVLCQYQLKAKSPIVFICSETHSDNREAMVNLFTASLKEQFNIKHITFNGVSATALKNALKRVTEIIKKHHGDSYNVPSSEMIECVVNSSGGDVRSAILNLHFACLKGVEHTLETSIFKDKEKTKATKRKKQKFNKFMSIGKNETVSILHGVGRVLSPKVVNADNGTETLTHLPVNIIEQFISQPNSFVNFLQENYSTHFSNIDHLEKAATGLSDADCMLAEWKEKLCKEYGLYTAVASMMLSNKAPLLSWNPVRGPKSSRIQAMVASSMPLLEQSYMYKSKVLVTDYQTYYRIINR